MLALQIYEVGDKLELSEIGEPNPAASEVIVSLKTAALNHRDIWLAQGKYPGLKFPFIPGSDGAGICEERPVVINPGLYWGDNEIVQSDRFRVLGMPDQGTLAEKIVIPRDHVYSKPEHLSWEEAAALPLAGLTAYRALIVQGFARPGERILISGIGGGVALMAMQLAVAHGMEVFVTSGSVTKLRRASEMGAVGGVNYKDQTWVDELTAMAGGFDLVIDSAGGEGFRDLVKLLKPGGRIIMYGGTLGRIDGLSPQVIFWRQITIKGCTMGSQRDFAQMLKFVESHEIHPVVDRTFALSEGQVALDYLTTGQQFGKVVLNISG